MTFQKLFSVLLLQLLLLLVLVPDCANASALKLGFYSKTCPRAEAVVTKTTSNFISRSPSLAPALLRLHFHDCFVRGCDASVLLNSTKINQAEKVSIPNLSLRGFQVIDAAKSALEKICPGVVSCADILTLVARDAVSMINGPYWEVPTGRRDGSVSIDIEAVKNLPSPYANITQLKANFASKGLNVKDLVVLSGAHTIGISHCSTISTHRLYNFAGKGGTDPKLDRHYASNLKKKCKPWDNETILEMDPGSSKSFDEHYYTGVAKRRGLFQSDASLLDDVKTKAYVEFQAIFHGATFAQDFAASKVKMGQIGVLTGKAGEIRKHCALVN